MASRIFELKALFNKFAHGFVRTRATRAADIRKCDQRRTRNLVLVGSRITEMKAPKEFWNTHSCYFVDIWQHLIISVIFIIAALVILLVGCGKHPLACNDQRHRAHTTGHIDRAQYVIACW